MRTRAFGLLALLLGVTVASTRAADKNRGSSAIKWADGSRAASDTWSQDDGCPARTGATETEPMTGPREVAWKFNVTGEVEGEPLAWKGRTFVVERSGGKRTLHVLSTVTGAEKFKQAFDSNVPLAPCLTEGRILLRTTPRTLVAYAVGEKALVSRWTFTAKSAMGPPTALRDEVYVVVDGVLSRLTQGSAEAVWPKGGATPVKAEGVTVAATAAAGKSPGMASATEFPRPSVRDTSVFLATGTRLVEVERRDGTVRREGRLSEKADPRLARVIVGLADVMVVCGVKFHEGERDADTVRLGLADSGPFDEHRPLSLPFGIASLGRDWVAAVGRGKTSALVLTLFEGVSTDTDESRDVVNATMHPEFLDAKVPPTTAGDVVLVGGRIFDAHSLELIRPEPLPCVSRVIPLLDRLVTVETKNRVTAWKSTAKIAEITPLRLFGIAGKPMSIAAAHVMLDDGRVVAGACSIDAKSGALLCASKSAAADKPPDTAKPAGGAKPAAANSWPLTAVRALLSDDTPRVLLLANRPSDAADAIALIARAESAGDLLALVPAAVESNDAALARRVLSVATDHGAAFAEISKLESSVAALESRAPECIAEKASDVEGRLTALIAREPDLLIEAASSLPAEAPSAYGLTLVRAAAYRAPYHAGATTWIRDHLPKGLSPRSMPDLGEWIDFIEFNPTGKVLILGPKMKIPDTVPAAVGEKLDDAWANWRQDVVGFLNGPLLVISPPEHPSAISRCLTYGRIVSDELDAEFASIGPRKAEDEILVLHLFPNKPEYLNQSIKERNQEPGQGFGGLENTAGHYSPSANVTRIFFPVGQGDSVIGTYTHELTHHWIGRRRPLRSADETMEDHAGGPGYFVVEGYADFVRSFAYDPAAGKANPDNPRAEYADVVAACPPASLVPWDKEFAMPQHEAYAMIEQGEVKLALRWRMGNQSHFSLGTLYYAQAAATTAYLYLADGGKYRPALMKHLYDHYAGASDPDALLKVCGCGADELGARIVAWCRAQVGAK